MQKNFSEIVAEITRKFVRSDPEFTAVIEGAVRRRYKQILRKAGWHEKVARDTLTLSANSDLLVLPRYMEDVISIYDTTSSRPLYPVGIEQIDLDLDDRTYYTTNAESTHFAKERVSSWNGTTPTDDLDWIVRSTNASDTGTVQVKMVDKSSGSTVTDTATINGQNTIVLSNLPDATDLADIVEFSKSGDTSGTISLEVNGVVFSKIGPQDRLARYLWVRIPYAASAATTMRVLYRRSMPSLDSANDVPVLDCDDLLEIGGYADGLRFMNSFQKAVAEEARFMDLLEDFIVEYELEGAEYAQARGSMSEYRRM